MEETLREFLEFPLWNSDGVFNKFRWLEVTEKREVVFKENQLNPKERFLYIEGSRANKVVLVAHADTVWDKCYTGKELEQEIVRDGNYFKGAKSGCGIGADDRAGCAIIWLLRNSGHSILITDGEEHGGQGSNWLIANFPDIADRLNEHQFMIQLDRRNGSDFKCYRVGSDAFRDFITLKTDGAYKDAGRSSFTDICYLCQDICGVNFSIGYDYEHTDSERINILEWENTYKMLTKLLTEDNLPRFEKTEM